MMQPSHLYLQSLYAEDRVQPSSLSGLGDTSSRVTRWRRGSWALVAFDRATLVMAV